jgi:hypothetical protein
MGGNSVAELRGDISNCVKMINNNKQWLTSKGIGYICYEGGQHCIKNAATVNRDPAIYQAYLEYLAAMNTVTDDVFAHYAHCGTFGSGGAWGALEFTGQSIADAHKYRALVKWEQDHPNPSVDVIANRSLTGFPYVKKTPAVAISLFPPFYSNFGQDDFISLNGRMLNSSFDAAQISRHAPGAYITRERQTLTPATRQETARK